MERELAAGENPDRPLAQYPPLHYALLYGHPQIARRLLAAGADATATDGRGESVLVVCASARKLDDPAAAEVAAEAIRASGGTLKATRRDLDVAGARKKLALLKVLRATLA